MTLMIPIAIGPGVAGTHCRQSEHGYRQDAA